MTTEDKFYRCFVNCGITPHRVVNTQDLEVLKVCDDVVNSIDFKMVQGSSQFVIILKHKAFHFL